MRLNWYKWFSKSIYFIFVLYASAYIYKTSFVINGTRYFSLFDDAMVSMRYARNLASGNGLVWNPWGEKIEGFTNPGWVFYMALIHLLPLHDSKISLLIQASGALFLFLNLVLVRKLAEKLPDSSRFTTITALLFTAFYLPINTWSLQGMEVSVLILLVSASVLISAKLSEGNSNFSLLLLTLSLAVIVRLDMLLLYIGIVLFVCKSIPHHRKKYLLEAAIVLALLIGVQTLLRWWYYDDVLPNTYYLKLVGYPTWLRLTRGVYVFAKFMWKSNLLLLFLPLWFALLHRKNSLVRLLCLCILIQVSYSIYTGGDAWEWWGGSNRFISVIMPLWFLLTAQGLTLLLNQLHRILKETQPHRVSSFATFFSYIIAIIVCICCFNSIYGLSALKELFLLTPPLHVSDNREMIERALLIREITRCDATIAVGWAGALPYFAERYSIDLLGKNDRYIAHLPMRVSTGWNRLIDFLPGHRKWDYEYSIAALRPDLIAEMWKSLNEAKDYLSDAYLSIVIQGYTFYARRDSGSIHWNSLRELDPTSFWFKKPLEGQLRENKY